MEQGKNDMWSLKQFILWDRKIRQDGRVDKIPVDPIGKRPINAHDPLLWMSYADAKQIGDARGLGVGFVVTEADPYLFFDIDNCLDEEGHPGPFAVEIKRLLDGAAVAVSQSGRGLHIICRGDVPRDRAIQSKNPPIDLYTDKRFVALSGNPFVGDVNADCSAGVATICERWLQPRGGGLTAKDWTHEPMAGYTGPDDDTELVAMARRGDGAAAAFGGKATFSELYDGNGDTLGKYYPDDHSGRDYDASKADMALAEKLAFWTGNNCERIRNIMRGSALYREKWDARPDYLERTILRAVGWNKKQYDKKPSANVEDTGGLKFLDCVAQQEYFKGCVYIKKKRGGLILMPNSTLLGSDSFRVAMGGQTFALGTEHGAKSTTNAFKAFTENQGYRPPMADEMYFNPNDPFQHTVTKFGRTKVNTYYPEPGEAQEGDTHLFERHLKNLLPDENDRSILLQYMAACVQKIGVKFKWCVVLQGVQGNGKTLLSTILSKAIGERYCYVASPDDLNGTNKFNAWMQRKLLVTVEEIHMQGAREVENHLKPFITNEKVTIQAKGEDQIVGDNFANFLIFSNYKDAVVKTANDRRYAVLCSAQQNVEDLARYKMTTQYFSRLFHWLEQGGGYAACTAMLLRYPVKHDVLGRAPHTSSTKAAIHDSLGPVEQEIIEAVESEMVGFRGGLIVYSHARALVDQMRMRGRISHNRLHDILTDLGYQRHPALGDGRLRIDGKRDRIYVHKQSDMVLVSDTDVIKKALQ